MNKNRHAYRSFGRRKFLAGVGALTSLSAFAKAGGGTALMQAAAGKSASADLLLTNGRIWTGIPGSPNAEAMAIGGNRIIAVGAYAELKELAGSAPSINLDGRFVMPGFNDSHIHMTRLAAQRRNVDLLGAKNIAEVIERIRERVAITPPGEWIESSAQWHEALMKEGRMPTRQELDSVSPDNPVILPRGGHIAAVNGKALEIAGITRDTPDPPGGIIVRDATGEPTGMLIEAARYVVARLQAPLSADSYRAAIRKEIAALNELGITSLTNPSLSTAEVGHLQALHAESPLNLRVHWTLRARSLDDLINLDIDGYVTRSDLSLRFSGIGEVGIDGGIEGAYLREPYEIVAGEQQDPDYRGIVTPLADDESTLHEFYVTAIERGLTIMTHVTGDGALDIALKVLENVRKESSFENLRWTLHGCFLTDEDQLDRVRDLNLYITAQTQPYLLGAQMLKWWGADRTNRSIPLRQFLDAGVQVAGGSDASAGIENPMESIGWMINRRCLGDIQLDKQWSITPEEALVLYTRCSAETQFMDAHVGTLKPGMLADVAVLAEDPLTAHPPDIGVIQNDATIVDGRVVFDRHGLFT